MSSVQINPISVSKSPILQLAVKQCMIEFAVEILKSETPVLSPTSGYKAYDKRMALAKQVIQNPDLYVEMSSRLVATIYPTIESDNNATSYYLTVGSGINFMKYVVSYDAPNNSGFVEGTIGQQLWDAIAGVTAADIPAK